MPAVLPVVVFPGLLLMRGVLLNTLLPAPAGVCHQ